ncbi:hypothetical protein [Streptomyces sp. NPDC001820]|uniref:hypothetical protein n=1 Tax=Streptomyces sp. NPDC001820 TaxID=3364613 RepID=UPI0036CDA192
MNWASLISAVLGAGIGITSTLLVDQARWRRDSHERLRTERREVYNAYLTALSRTRNGLREAARLPQEARAEQAREAFHTGGAYELRIQMTITAPGDLTARSEVAYRSLRALRNEIERGASHQDEEYAQRREAYEIALGALRREMRTDLRVDTTSDH